MNTMPYSLATKNSKFYVGGESGTCYGRWNINYIIEIDFIKLNEIIAEARWEVLVLNEAIQG
jgi:hypothetical protein